MKFRKFQLALIATALGSAMGVASAQGAGYGTGSVGTTSADSKAAASEEGSAALTREAAVSSPIAGSPGTQSGVAVNPDTTSMGAPASSQIFSQSSSQSFAGLSGTQMRLLQRHNALR